MTRTKRTRKNEYDKLKTCVTRRYEKGNCKKPHVWMRNAHKITSLINISDRNVQGETKISIKSSNWRMFIRVIRKLTLSSPSIWASFYPYPLFQWYPQSKDILLNLSIKCWNSTFNAQGSRLIIVGAVKIYVAHEKGKTGWNSVYHQNSWFYEFHPPLNANVHFCRF